MSYTKRVPRCALVVAARQIFRCALFDRRDARQMEDEGLARCKSDLHNND